MEEKAKCKNCTNEKEMIEEMAKDLKKCLPNDWYWQKSVDSDTYFVAKHFYNEGYRKIPEGSVVLSKEEKQKLLKEMYEQGKFDALADLEKDGKVVLSKEEYEHLKAKSTRIPIDQDGNFIEYAVYDTDKVLSKTEYKDYIYNKARKEAVKEALQELYEQIDEKTPKWVKVQIEMIAKRNGVEVEE